MREVSLQQLREFLPKVVAGRPAGTVSGVTR